MKFRIVKYSVSWLALILLIAAATMGLAVSFRQLDPESYNFIFLGLAWLLVVGSGIYLFVYASKVLLLKELSAREAEKNKDLSDIKSKKKPVTESESLNIDPVARKIVRRISPEEEPAKWGKNLLQLLASEIEIMSGVFYYRNKKKQFEPSATYAFTHAHLPYTFKEGEGLTGQAVANMAITIYTTIPEEYSEVFSGLGKVKPNYLAIIPFFFNGHCQAVLECAGFKYEVKELEHLFHILARELSEKFEPVKGADANG